MLQDIRDIDRILRQWPFDSESLSARVVRAEDGREVVQMRVELGILQMEVAGRPDGILPGDEPTYLDFLRVLEEDLREPLELDELQCLEVDREFALYYHRRLCWLALREHDRAVADADHTIALMDYVRTRCPSRGWLISHERQRPAVLLHRTQAAAMAELDANNPLAALHTIERGLDNFRDLCQHDVMAGAFESCEFVEQLVGLKEWIYEKTGVPRTLCDQLADAVASEQFELAARLRDQLQRQECTSADG